MNRHRIVSNFALLALAGCLTLNGCKQSGTPQANNQQANNPQTAQPAGAPAGGEQPGGLPGVQTQPPSAEPSASPSANAGGYEGQQAPTASAAPIEIPAGTRLPVRLSRELGSGVSQSGESFSATVAEDVVADGMTVIPRGARAEGTVVDAKSRGKIKGAAVLTLRLKQIEVNGAGYPVSTNTYEKVLAGKGRRSAKFIGGGGGLGALIGGIAGGGKGALIGAGAGAGAGAAGGAFTGNKQIVLPAGTVVSFRLQRALRLQ